MASQQYFYAVTQISRSEIDQTEIGDTRGNSMGVLNRYSEDHKIRHSRLISYIGH